MTILFLILIIIASVLLGLIVLIQNQKAVAFPAFGGFGNQIMGVKQTTDVLEKKEHGFSRVLLGCFALFPPCSLQAQPALPVLMC